MDSAVEGRESLPEPVRDKVIEWGQSALRFWAPVGMSPLVCASSSLAIEQVLLREE